MCIRDRYLSSALYSVEQALSDLIREAEFARHALRLAVDLAGTEDGQYALGNALSIASNPGASGTIVSNAEKALTNLAVAHMAIRVSHAA